MVYETADALRADLALKTLVLTFRKKDNTMRVMRATLQPEKIPGSFKTSEVSVSNPNLIRVYDVVVDGWRSVLFDTITNIEEYVEEIQD